MADCRKCVYFIPVEEMSDYDRENALRWVRRRRPHARLLGWCKAYERPVTYYKGDCPRYVRREPRFIPLDSFVGGE